MEKEIQIRPMPRFWKYIPLVGADLTVSRYPIMYLPEHIYARWLNDKMTTLDEGMFIHEMTHLQRQKKMGVWSFYFKYILSRKFRLHEELVAIKEQMKFLKSQGTNYDFTRKAKQFASYEYFWVTRFEEGKMMLEGLWSEI